MTAVATRWEAVIGMEVHVQLATRSKMFCACPTDYLGRPPNTNVCPVCLGLPGVLPVINKRAVELCLKAALALNCTVQDFTKFDRKNYFYPDLPKGYQISQYDLPMSRHGWLELEGKRVGIRRVHLEEDTGKLVHAGDKLQLAGTSFVDLNRSGVPLMEIVSEPDIGSAAEARDYAIALRAIMRAIGASEADMEKGHLRVEPNVSIRSAGATELGVKTELKNLNSFRALHLAVEHEIERQATIVESGGDVVQETRGWSEPERRTFSQRSKEVAEDYRYFPEPDLPPLAFDAAWIEELRRSLPELPAARRGRLVEEHGLGEQDARVLAEDDHAGRYFDGLLARGVEAKLAASWVVNQLRPLEGEWPPVETVAGVLVRQQAGEITSSQARAIFSGAATTVVADEEVAAAVERVIVANPKAVADYKAGNQGAIGVLVRAVRDELGPTANLKLANQLLRERLAS